MEEECVVASIKGSFAYVSLKSPAKACGGCKACIFGKNKANAVPAIMQEKCQKGDTVLVKLPESEIKSASFILYLLPIVFLFIGFFIGGLFNNEVIQALFALLFCAASFILIWAADKLFRKKKYMPVIIKIINKNN